MLPVEFAAQRAERLDRADRELEPLVVRALERYGNGEADWHDELTQAAGQLWLEHFEAEAPGRPFQRPYDRFRGNVAESLERTRQPEGEVDEAQIERVTNWLSTYAVNAGTVAGAYGRGIRYKRWTTMHDAAVRDIHVPLDGQVAPIGGTFDVAGSKLGYPGEPIGPPEVWINCRCLAMPAARTGETMSVRTYTVGPDEQIELDNPSIIPSDDAFATTVDETDIAVEVADEDELPVDELEEGEELITEIPVHGVAAIEGKPTGDGRSFDRDAVSFGALPQPLGYEFESSHGGDNSRVAFIGRIDEYWKVDKGDYVEVRWRGVVHPDKEHAGEAIDGIIDGSRGGLSIIADEMALNVEATQAAYDAAEGEGKQPVQHLSLARIRRFDMVPTGAYQEAYIALGGAFEDELDEDERAALAACGCLEPAEVDAEALTAAASFAPGTKDGPGWITHPIPTQRIRNYWVRGKGAAKIRWGVGGDFNRCRMQLAKYVQNPEWLAGLCANMHYEALGIWPAQHAGHSARSGAPLALAASATARTVFPAEGFEEVPTSGAIPMRIDPETRRIWGYVAQWGSCHLGIQGMCQQAPFSKNDYAFFLKGIVDTDKGEQRVGVITYGIGHASDRMRAAAATAHYDKTDAIRAYINVGENAYGIWYSGYLDPDVTDEQIAKMRAIGAVSGDWRSYTGRPEDMELIGLVVVNTPAFALAASAGVQQTAIGLGFVPSDGHTLVASASMRMDPEEVAAIARMAVEEYRHQENVAAVTAPARERYRVRELAAARARIEGS